MIDKLQRIAQAIQFLRLPSIAIGFICLAAMVVIILISSAQQSDRFLIPCIVGLLWAISNYFFLVTFRSIPERSNNSLNYFSKLKRNIHRGWYYLIGVVFLGTTMAVILVTYRMISIWLRDYGG